VSSRWAIIGAAGYTAGELIRLLLHHPHARVAQALSSSAAGRRVGDVHPNLRGLCDLELSSAVDLSQLDGVFFCGSHGEAMRRIPPLLSERPQLRVIDFSADFRLRDPALYPTWYDREHSAPELLPSFVYGLPELFRGELRGALRVANPGCFATAIALALAPLSRAGLEVQVAVTAVTGSSGSGSRPSVRTHHPTRAATMQAYQVLGHRHTPEILQALSGRVRLSFVPVSGPFVRGIYACCQVGLPAGWDRQRVIALYRELYADTPFVRLLDRPPDLQAVNGSNFCDLHLVVEGGRLVVLAAIDNLVKGAAGQAVQNLNLCMGWDEGAGLRHAGGYP
jgi:N-acetyl-gamma-glutamyl-phosphate/LysW-gamma-L-alpha-aminoadipyl-6-phosphate reductase